jgi:hypothetical protein
MVALDGRASLYALGSGHPLSLSVLGFAILMAGQCKHNSHREPLSIIHTRKRDIDLEGNNAQWQPASTDYVS